MIKVIKTNKKVTFYLNGKQVFPIYISGNIYEFENGELILL